jgi:hypothetical protein
VVTEMARALGERGIWVDHVTTLDPIPVPAFGDAAVTTWENVPDYIGFGVRQSE